MPVQANTWFPSNKMQKSPNLTYEPLCDGGYREWYIWIPHEKLDRLSLKESHSMSQVGRKSPK